MTAGQRYPVPDWAHWLARDRWWLDEAVALSLGINPIRLSDPMGGRSTWLARMIRLTEPISFSGATPLETALQQIASKAGLAVENNGVNVVLSSPYFSGSVYDQIRDAIEAADCYASIDYIDRKIVIAPMGTDPLPFFNIGKETEELLRRLEMAEHFAGLSLPAMMRSAPHEGGGGWDVRPADFAARAARTKWPLPREFLVAPPAAAGADEASLSTVSYATLKNAIERRGPTAEHVGRLSKMPARAGPFYVFEIAQALSRLPGRVEIDQDEAHRIGADMYDWYRRGGFTEHEVVAQYGDPLRWGPITQREEEARQRGEGWEDLHLGLWYVAIALTYHAAKRYVEGCGLAGAKRLLSEWFGSPEGRKGQSRPTDAELDQWMAKNVTATVKRDSTLELCRKQTGATHREALAAWNRLPEDKKRRRGQKDRP
jgi:hypothetical protein